MSERFIKFIPSEEALYLAKKHPKAFILLVFVAERARQKNGLADGLTVGQCHVGDWENMGLTRQEYRTALNVLINKRFLEKVETCRTRQNSTKRITTIGTLVKLCDSRVFDINIELDNHRSNHRPTTDQPPTNHEEERKRRISLNRDIQEERAQSAARLRSKDVLSFDFEKYEFVGIVEKDVVDWHLIYPHIDIRVETLKAAQWVKSNPSKGNKKNWRKFLTGWFQRSNDSIENKKAYRSASGANQDRRTKDINGNPVESPHTGRF
jgi:hypothetical protein